MLTIFRKINPLFVVNSEVFSFKVFEYFYNKSFFILILLKSVAFSLRTWYNFMRDAEVAQQVEQRTENPRVNGPIPFLGTFLSGSSSVVECLLAKEEVASSNLVFRSILFFRAEVAE